MLQLFSPTSDQLLRARCHILSVHKHTAPNTSSSSSARSRPAICLSISSSSSVSSLLRPSSSCTCNAHVSHTSYCKSSYLCGSSTIPTRSRTSSSSRRSLPEYVTRTVLSCSGAMMYAGVSPAGVAAFSSAVSSSGDSSSSSSSGELPSSLRVTFSPVSGDQAEMLSDCLLGFGAQSVVVEESRDEGQAEQEKFGAEAELWDRCRVIVHFALEHDVEESVSAARDILDLPDLTYSSESVVDQQWMEQIKASYVPVQISEGLYIVPEWSEPTDTTAINIRLTPGVAFGTGEHPTTKLCLRYLASLGDKLSATSIMDYGTGSGVLAIAGLLLGAANAVGTDTDPLAVRAAEANAALNGLQDKFMVLRCGANLDDPEPLAELSGDLVRQFDLVVANILRGPLIQLQPRLTSYCKPGGLLALSGILNEQAPDVVDQYGPYFEDFHVSSEGSWALVTARRKKTL